MKRIIISLVGVVGCGEVKTTMNDASSSDGAVDIDGPPADARVDGPPADAARFASGMYGFEDLAGGNPLLPHDISGGSGATLSKPAPNPGGSLGVFLVDCNGNSGAFGFGCATGQQHIPEGRRFVVYADFNTALPFEFTFPADIGAFSIAISCTNGGRGQYQLVGIDSGDVDVAFAEITTGTIENWRSARVEITRPSGFRKVQIRPNGASSGVIAIDALRWTSN